MLTDEERKQLLCDVGCTGEHSRYCAAAMPGVYRVQMEADDLTERVESIVAARVRAARAQELRDASDEARTHAVSCPEPEHCNDRRLCAVHNETTADWLWDRAERLDPRNQLQDPKD